MMPHDKGWEQTARWLPTRLPFLSTACWRRDAPSAGVAPRWPERSSEA